MSEAFLGQDWAGSLGSIRITREGQCPTFRITAQLVDVPVDESRIRRQVVGSDMAEVQWAWHGSAELLDLLTYKNDGTVVPNVRWIRERRAEALSAACMGRVPGLEETQEPDAVTVRTINIAPDGTIYHGNPGVLFDWEADLAAPAAGATAAVDGPWINTGALASGESFDVFLLNLHDPAPTTSDTDWIIESATDGVGTGLATVAASATADFNPITATPEWQIVSIDGPFTPTYLRVGIETPVDGTSYPMAIIVGPRPTNDPPM